MYKFRWIHAGIVSLAVLVAGLHFLILPVSGRLSSMHTSLAEVDRQMVKARRQRDQERKRIAQTPVKMHALPHSMQSAYLPLIQALVSASGLQLLSVKDTAPHKRIPETGRFHLVLSGGFQRAAGFAEVLVHYLAPAAIFNFSYQNHQLEIDMAAGEAHAPANVSVISTLPANDPVCRGAYPASISIPAEADTLLTLPLQQMQMTGYFIQDKKMMALLLLNHGALAVVDVGMRIGLERGLIQSVNQNGVVVMLAPHHEIVIRPAVD